MIIITISSIYKNCGSEKQWLNNSNVSNTMFNEHLVNVLFSNTMQPYCK